MLAINAKSSNAAAAWKLIQYLTSSVGRDRARRGDRRPAVAAVGLHAARSTRKAPYFKEVKTLNGYAQPRPVSPKYLQISVDLQNAFSSVFANIGSPELRR